MTTGKFKINDRVKRISVPGGIGTVKELRTEVSASSVETRSSTEARERNLMVSVQWDTGTQSYMTPESLEVVSK